jgi:hypothetical protein
LTARSEQSIRTTRAIRGTPRRRESESPTGGSPPMELDPS